MKSEVLKDKGIKVMLTHLEQIVGAFGTGKLIAIMCDSLANFVKGSEQGRDMRTIEIKYNDYFSTKYDFETNEYVE